MEKGASGYCDGFKYNKYFSEGNYANDLLNGPQILDIDLSKQTAYYGGAINGEFTGKTSFFTNRVQRPLGLCEGRFNGNGYRLEPNGRQTVKFGNTA